MKLWPLLVLFGIQSSPARAELKQDAVKTWKLKNGLKVIFLPDDSIPNANMYTFWKVGSRNEYPGITGLSHFFEHMMFNGSKKYPAGSFDKVMEAAGGANNAYTTSDITAYTNWFPSSALATIVDLEADRIGALQIDQAKIESERGVVLSERSTGLENDAWDLLYQNLRSVAFTAHPYNWPVIGWESDIKAWTQKDLEDYFQTYYNPSNAVVVMVGDLEQAEVERIMAEKLEPIARAGEVPAVRTVEPPQLGEKRLFVAKPSSSSAQLMIAYHVPAAQHPDYYALDLLSEILSGGASSRLYRSLVDEKRLASEVSTNFGPSLDPELFLLSATAIEGKEARRIEKAMLDELEKLKKMGIRPEELTKAKNRKVVSLYRQMETINGKASLLGQYEVYFGGFEQLFKAGDRYQAVTREDISRVLKTYFAKSNRTIGILAKREDSDAH